MDYAVRGTTRGTAPKQPSTSEWTRITDIETADWTGILKDCDYVVHLAALAHQLNRTVPAEEFDRTNRLGTSRLASAIAESPSVRRLIFISSIGAVCSQSDLVVTEETPCNPDTDYGRSKRTAELEVQRILAGTTADWCILRPTLVYGPENPGNMLRLMRLTRSGLPLPFGSIRNQRSFLYVGNLVDLIINCLQNPAASRQVFNVADTDILSTPELISRIARVCGQRARLLPAPVWSLRLLGRAGDLAAGLAGRSLGVDTYSINRLLGSLQVSGAALKSKLGWTPPYSTEQGLQETFKTS
jgi:nucleoside-diphosphate-sugar epimerase